METFVALFSRGEGSLGRDDAHPPHHFSSLNGTPG
jgi:hypothetical protein